MMRLALHAPGALEYFATLVADDNEFALFEAAIRVEPVAEIGLGHPLPPADLEPLVEVDLIDRE